MRHPSSSPASAPSRRRLLGIAVAGLAGGALLPAAARAQTASAATPLSAQDQADLARVQAYLDGIETLTARFVQSESNGTAREGMLYVQRPGRLRFVFEPDGPYEIIADGDKLWYVNNGAPTELSLDSTPLSLLLGSKVRIDQRLTVLGFERGPGILAIRLKPTRDTSGAVLTVVFNDRPLALQRWSIAYRNGQTVTVGLTDLRTGVPVDPKHFVYRLPLSPGRF